jgi:DNA-directed RNA polymerase subunit RPC12/RpoP
MTGNDSKAACEKTEDALKLVTVLVESNEHDQHEYMPSITPYVICPNCKKTLEKPPGLDLMASVAADGGDFIMMSSSATIPCLYCGHKMLKSDVVAGKFDAPSASSGKCFIATAACGSADVPDVMALRHFRDQHLRSNSIGRKLIQIYEQISPPLAAKIADRPFARWLVRWLLIRPTAWLLGSEQETKTRNIYAK